MEGSLGVRKGAWCKEEDDLLRACIHRYGEGNWDLVPQRSGLNRCRKSCRMRWLNYLKPNIKKEDCAEDEIDMISRMHKLIGHRWSLIAGRIPGRTANHVKNFWNNYTSKKNKASSKKDETNEKPKETHVVIRPQVRTFSRNTPWLRGKLPTATPNQHESAKNSSSASQVSVVTAALASPQSQDNWWARLFEDPGRKEGDIICSFNGLDGNFMNDLWDNGEFTGMTIKDNDRLMEDPIDWSGFLPSETNPLCGSLS